MSNPKVDVIVDLQFGSTGKGLIAGYLAKRGGYDVVVNANMPNAGHTFVDSAGRKWVHKVLPNGIVGENVKVVGLGPGSVFDVSRLEKEMTDSADLLVDKDVIIHEAAVVLDDRHREAEANSLSKISSTMQGSAAAMIEKISRNPESKILAIHNVDKLPVGVRVVTHHEWIKVMADAENILLEGAQGYSLGINSGFWPYCTSRDCTPARFLADCAIPANWLNKVIGTARVHPIRVGNTKDGYSGDFYPDQKEISWGDLGVDPELTTVTGRVRRVFTFSAIQIHDAVLSCQPTDVFLNFMNYDRFEGERVRMEINNILRHSGPEGAQVTWTGWGPTEDEVRREY